MQVRLLLFLNAAKTPSRNDQRQESEHKCVPHEKTKLFILRNAIMYRQIEMQQRNSQREKHPENEQVEKSH